MGFELDNDDRVFSEPWEAQAFAIVLTLSSAGCFTWEEWAKIFSEVIAESKIRGGPSDGSDYYLNWVKALERIVSEKRITDISKLKSAKLAWENAYKITPHGKPVHLDNSKPD
ncbi:MAG: nitrile hydratase accessory protein [Gammaproteobacteria bacterium]|nr:nitrile hydratase accessory protein [Gammaproteobacteria bacterium]